MTKLREQEDFVSGHRACAGCGLALGARLAMKGVEQDSIATCATGCLEVISTPYPESSWEIPWIHSLFENSASVAAGIEAALKAKGDNETKVIAQGGDGATVDIGMRGLSGMFERGHDVTYICYDNEAYMNTGIQRSGATPLAASTTTSPPGKQSYGNENTKKDALAIAASHGVGYVASASIAYPKDVVEKVKKAAELDGPSYVQIHVPCPTGWGFKESDTIEIARLAVETALWPVYEMENGEIINIRKIKNRKPVEEYLEKQKRYKHLFKKDNGQQKIEQIQEIANRNAKTFELDK
ncbi:Pyruvate:ferredoxin oxidoreductase beta subunit PorB [Methanonatronarchaeum thermophilum]|uniref:Pyruvate:ferredoxin oxidoreductase beta subunit PorB n=1 Tax=Methanonatronarchaeum thermophilum TaxID=1927129 RepID=A0A1Y3GDX4_9EURY|nr:thiamine pyrophosphate-dependent enzyme [Methanonatronarchaeum thermophilum]OUJ19460.1 Pyruvate:ferredoxin oxidoreductase beta subunit PorB [Methanonatronarchaeum thermophilum]